MCVCMYSVMDGQKASKPYQFNYYERWLVMTIDQQPFVIVLDEYVCVVSVMCTVGHCYPFHIDHAFAHLPGMCLTLYYTNTMTPDFGIQY